MVKSPFRFIGPISLVTTLGALTIWTSTAGFPKAQPNDNFFLFWLMAVSLAPNLFTTKSEYNLSRFQDNFHQQPSDNTLFAINVMRVNSSLIAALIISKTLDLIPDNTNPWATVAISAFMIAITYINFWQTGNIYELDNTQESIRKDLKFFYLKTQDSRSESSRHTRYGNLCA